MPHIVLFSNLKLVFLSPFRIVFPHRKKSKKADEIVHKKYILSTETMMMGPLLAGKSRDRYKEGKYPENTEKLTICNTTPLEAEVTFCYQHDNNAATFILDPPSMVLKPGEQQVCLHFVCFFCVCVCSARHSKRGPESIFYI